MMGEKPMVRSLEQKRSGVDLSGDLRRRKHRRHRLETTTLGLVILVLAIVGLCVVIGVTAHSAYSYIRSYLGPAETPKFFEDYISPVVMQDPKPFANISEVNQDWMMKTAILATLSADDNGKYALTDDNREIVPASDISREFESLFGGKIKPKFETFTDNNTKYEYNRKETSYYIPMIAYVNIFTPKVRNIVRNHDTVRLTVDYIPGSGWVQNADGTTTSPPASKTMIYTLKGSRGKYAIVSLENGPSGVDGVSSGYSAASQAASSDAVSSSQDPDSRNSSSQMPSGSQADSAD